MNNPLSSAKKRNKIVSNEREKLLLQGVIAEHHTPPYKIHRYFARRPWNVFNQLVSSFSNESDIVLDPFMGGGVTIYEGLRLNRKVVGFDINPLSVFIVQNMIKKEIDLVSLKNDFHNLLNFLRELYDPFELIEDDNSQRSLINGNKYVDWYELAHIIYCNYCGKEIVLSNKNKLANGRYSCRNRNCKGNSENNGYVEPKNCKRNGYQYLYSVTIMPGTRKKIIEELNENDIKRIENHVEALKKKLDIAKIDIPQDRIPLNWDRQHEDLLKNKSIHTFQDLFTKRNLYINLLLLHKIKSGSFKKDNYEILRFIFSDSLRDTNIMAFTNENWQSGRPTTWAKHAYWIPSQFCELNILNAFQLSYKAIEDAIEFNKKQTYEIKKANSFDELQKGKNILLLNDSLSNSDLPGNGVDVIITDPPYGSNVQYLELSHFWYVWNKDLYKKRTINFSKEAVANRKKNFRGAKNYYDYEENLFIVFKRAFEVLKPDRFMVLTFNNKDINAWLALLISIFRAGFSFDKGGLYFQEGIKNYKQTAHTKAKGSPYGDFIYVFRKTHHKKHERTELDKPSLIKLIYSSINKNIHKKNRNVEERNEIKRNIFLEIIPEIEQFVKTTLLEKRGHDLYDIFKKDIFNDLYEINM